MKKCLNCKKEIDPEKDKYTIDLFSPQLIFCNIECDIEFHQNSKLFSRTKTVVGFPEEDEEFNESKKD